jgi:hypothetical protein
MLIDLRDGLAPDTDVRDCTADRRTAAIILVRGGRVQLS